MQLSIPGILGELVAKEDKRGELNVSRFPSLHPIMRLKAVLDRRLQKRTRTDIPVTVYRDSLSYPATLCDISSHGIGLREIGQLRVGDVVTVEIGPSVLVRGTVVWSENHRAGIELTRAH
ncbi:MAG: PilZ domain-containing protein [Hyphomicrobium sp.]